MIGLLDFEGGDKKKEEKGNEREKGKEPSFFLFFLFSLVCQWTRLGIWIRCPVCVFFIYFFFYTITNYQLDRNFFFFFFLKG